MQHIDKTSRGFIQDESDSVKAAQWERPPGDAAGSKIDMQYECDETDAEAEVRFNGLLISSKQQHP